VKHYLFGVVPTTKVQVRAALFCLILTVQDTNISVEGLYSTVPVCE
jgi:hypothetical protein